MNQKIITLFTKYLDNHCTQEELQEVYAYLEQGCYLEEWDLVLSNDAAEVLSADRKSALSEAHIKQLHDRLLNQIKPQHIVEHEPQKRWQVPTIAASFTLLLLSAVIYCYVSIPQQRIAGDKASAVSTTVLPGKNQATLLLADGKEIALNDTDLGQLGKSYGLTVSKTADGVLAFEVDAKAAKAATNGGYHTVRTPCGGQYQVVLPDGSHVWLNAASSLRFPASFAHNKREVTLEGEAYFTIAQSTTLAPFSVKTQQQEVQVLGTEFNVTAYPDDPVHQICLVTGAVQVKNAKQTQQMRPGQVATIAGLQAPILLKREDPSNYIAWKQGLFTFKEEHIYSLMKKIARWYNVEVAYEGDMRGKVFSGTFSRFADVQDVLNILEATGTIKLSLKERRIMVTP